MDEVKLKLLAEDIIHERVYTSRHIYYYCKEDERKWLDTMFRVFNADQLSETILNIKDEIKKSSIEEGVLFYAYKHYNINPNQEDLPIFKEADYVYGEDLAKLNSLLQTIKQRLH